MLAGLLVQMAPVKKSKTTKSSPDRLHRCHLCNEAFRRPSHLKIHLLSHSGERPFKCNLCEKYVVEIVLVEVEQYWICKVFY